MRFKIKIKKMAPSGMFHTRLNFVEAENKENAIEFINKHYPDSEIVRIKEILAQ